ncbi:MAG: hypothetical protein EZS28_046002 [Streblomastix strix]|uniref:Uncharacterized protein n=1 Tax=Streblomastix strix TaxID=222440 RepID=A0A5J4TLR2_9EUKA|nr:MAG: hypothetical protein EZS28_046002 [Streblomastix strix]
MFSEVFGSGLIAQKYEKAPVTSEKDDVLVEKFLRQKSTTLHKSAETKTQTDNAKKSLQMGLKQILQDIDSES